ncbi:hypothetical protein AF335_05590 [Streptomyces eurocidicus]|uniref:MFS family permease n=1 Tax=Streptomyces eurocidicus TaxID=66423 RepID=A0A2N8NZE4_STREU|nr:hypothetical protein [Streptomyces eurocidicus]MBB5120839.1 MFS family permease [Streptomyces eurocidicus]MBF6054461.1 hypothetical protein [Streptomyces eurocidicus]PNE34137.1 hypothetical protein AF335_05590 [Streptomyces eurocidicus]
MALGLGAFALTLHLAGTEVTIRQTAPALIVAGLGIGLVIGPFFDTVLSAVEPHETGSASGTLTAAQQLGSALGSAALGTVFYSALADQGTTPPGYAHTMQITLGAGAGLLALAFLASFLLPRPTHPHEH